LNVVVEVVKNRGKTLVLVEHSLEEVLPFVDRVLVIHEGEIIRDGTATEVLTAGDIPNVFTRPPIVQLSEKFNINPFSLTPDDFYESMQTQYKLGTISNFDVKSNDASLGELVVKLQNISFSYNQNNSVLNNVDLNFHEGEIVAILGRNGSGKTTLVRPCAAHYRFTAAK
jgi:energy-coupling factor transport system ATP-binding protein